MKTRKSDFFRDDQVDAFGTRSINFVRVDSLRENEIGVIFKSNGSFTIRTVLEGMTICTRSEDSWKLHKNGSGTWKINQNETLTLFYPEGRNAREDIFIVDKLSDSNLAYYFLESCYHRGKKVENKDLVGTKYPPN